MNEARGYIKSPYTMIGAIGHTDKERENNDFYATPAEATEMLLQLEQFNQNIWEPACGKGHIANVLKSHGYTVQCTDLIDRGYGKGQVDFLKQSEIFSGDIITNPPYKYAKEFVEKALSLVASGSKVAMFLKLQFLEGKARRKLFDQYPPYVVYISSSRLKCGRNGIFKKNDANAICYAWFIWKKGFSENPVIKWFN